VSQPCAWCRTDFQPARTDAEYCSARCRQSAYRARTKLRGEHRDEGWPKRAGEYGWPGVRHCTHILPEGRCCPADATWRLEQQSNRAAVPGPWAVSYWCDTHLPEHLAPYEVAVVHAGYTSACYR